MDLALAAVALLVFSIPMVVIAAAIRLAMGAPVLFRQTRPGLHGRPFTIYKFRTMRDARAPGGELLGDEQRITALGHFLRETSLDELPSLWNVLRGDLSFVGPRPLLMRYLDLYTPEQARRHEVPPGITGLAQINGRNAIGWDEKFRYDTWYADNWDHVLDVKILFATLKAVVQRRGVRQPGRATVDYFAGSAPAHNLDK